LGRPGALGRVTCVEAARSLRDAIGDVALGDQVNEAARIEACATGGRTLASKDLVERLHPSDAAALNLDIDRVAYTRLSDLTTATDKARRDAPAIAVCEV
jgi:class 3 adenylate cyclase